MTHVTRPGLQELCRNLPEAAERIGTPFFSYDWKTIHGTLDLMLSSATGAGFSNDLKFYLAFFALPNTSLFKRISSLDSRIGISCNTPEEIVALHGAGWSEWDRVALSGGVLPKDDLLRTANTGCLINAASIGNLRLLVENRAPCHLGLRIDLEDHALKGLRRHELQPALHLATNGNKPVEALHAYPGTEVKDLELLVHHARTLLDVAQCCNTLNEINFGGGFWYDYDHASGDLASMIQLRTYFKSVRSLLNRAPKRRSLRATWEPGRIAFAAAGFFIMRVIETRSNGDDCPDVYVDASFTHIPSPKIRNRQHHVVVVDAQGRRKTENRYRARLCGATTLSTDQILPHPCLIPEVKPDDFIILLDVGAYGRAGSYNFLGKSTPPEILMNDSKWHLIRERQRPDHLLGLIPDAHQ